MPSPPPQKEEITEKKTLQNSDDRLSLSFSSSSAKYIIFCFKCYVICLCCLYCLWFKEKDRQNFVVRC